jgi:CHAT domain-containing protein
MASSFDRDKASKAEVKKLSEANTLAKARYVHFATHGLLDEQRPLSSALALTLVEPPEEGRDNGLLQAWEIFEQVRLSADLVTLSACDTGLGAQIRGEGIVGLTRAFQYAGARSVLASLWSVADDETAALMIHFYERLSAGLNKDEALRAAQIASIRGGMSAGSRSGTPATSRATRAFFWAAFQVYGDWR